MDTSKLIVGIGKGIHLDAIDLNLKALFDEINSSNNKSSSYHEVEELEDFYDTAKEAIKILKALKAKANRFKWPYEPSIDQVIPHIELLASSLGKSNMIKIASSPTKFLFEWFSVICLRGDIKLNAANWATEILSRWKDLGFVLYECPKDPNNQELFDKLLERFGNVKKNVSRKSRKKNILEASLTPITLAEAFNKKNKGK